MSITSVRNLNAVETKYVIPTPSLGSVASTPSPDIKPGFIRRMVNAVIAKDGKTAECTVLDVEHSYCLGSATV